MKFFGLYITITNDYKDSVEFYKSIADDCFHEMEDCKAALEICKEENARLKDSVKNLRSANLTLDEELKEMSNEKSRIYCRWCMCKKKLSDELNRKCRGFRKLRQKFQKAILKYKSEILDLKESCNELASDNILISRKLEQQEDCATELACYKAAISRCKRRCRNVSNSPESILKSLLSEVDKYYKR